MRRRTKLEGYSPLSTGDVNVLYKVFPIPYFLVSYVGSPHSTLFLEKNGRIQEFELPGWLESDYNVLVAMLLVVAGIMCFLNFYME